MTKSWLKLYVHYVWATKHRVPHITQSVEKQIHNFVKSECRKLGCEPVAIGGMPDHIHLLLQMNASVSPSELMKQVKGKLAHTINKEEWQHNSDTFAWQNGYGALSIDYRQLDQVISYIHHQKEHHSNKQTILQFEKMAQ